MSWNFDSGNSNSVKAEFTKFPVGVTRIRVIDSEPHIRWTHWMDNIRKSVNCPGQGCPICAIRKAQKANGEQYTYGMSRRFAINILNLETQKLEIMEQGVGFFEDLRDLKSDLEQDNKALIDAIIKVRRRGTDRDNTSYRLDIDEVSELTETQKEMIKNRINLAEYFKPHTVEQLTRLIGGESWESVMKSGNDDDEEVVVN